MAYEWHTTFKDNSCVFSFHAFEALSMSFNAIFILDVQETRKLKFRQQNYLVWFKRKS